MADILTDMEVKALSPTKAEKATIAGMKLPRFVDRKNVIVVTDALTGERGFTIQQELPAYLRRSNVKRYSVQSAERKVSRREMRDVKRRAKSLADRALLNKGEWLELPGANGEKLFYKVIRQGWFHARYCDINGRGRLIIDKGPTAAVLEPDLQLYEGFREV